MSGPESTLTLEDHEKAFVEVAFLVDLFSTTIDATMGGATAPVGRIAGREMARKLPVRMDNPDLSQVMDELAGRMRAGFAFSSRQGTDTHEVLFDRCALRQVCALRRLELGGPICRLFHAYFDGVVNELMNRPTKSTIAACGDQCRIELRTQ